MVTIIFLCLELYVLVGIAPAHAFKERATLGDLAQGPVGEADEVVCPCSRHRATNRPNHVHPNTLVSVCHNCWAKTPHWVHRCS